MTHRNLTATRRLVVTTGKAECLLRHDHLFWLIREGCLFPPLEPPPHPTWGAVEEGEIFPGAIRGSEEGARYLPAHPLFFAEEPAETYHYPSHQSVDGMARNIDNEFSYL